MAGELVGGAILGTAFSELYKCVHILTRESTHFKDLARSIDRELKLECLLPLVKRIQDQNMELDLSNQSIQMLRLMELVEGLKLVRNCSKVGSLNISRKLQYTKELQKLDGSLKRWLDILMVNGVRDGKETLQLVRMMLKIMMLLAIFIVAFGVLVLTILVLLSKPNPLSQISTMK